MWAKIKALPWLVTLGVVLAAVAMAMNGGKIRKLQRRATRKQNAGIAKKNTGIKRDLEKSTTLMDSAQDDLDAVDAAAEAMEANIKEITRVDQTVDSIADKFNSDRKRLHFD